MLCAKSAVRTGGGGGGGGSEREREGKWCLLGSIGIASGGSALILFAGCQVSKERVKVVP